MEPDFYQILKVGPAATFTEIHKAYRTLALQYHPDRNTSPDAGPAMAAINEAYWVLSDVIRRRDYDRGRVDGKSFDVAGPVLRAAYETLLQQGWMVADSNDSLLVLQNGLRVVRVSFVPKADNGVLKRLGKQFGGFSVVMAVEIETPFNLSFTTAIIDLMHSRHYGAPFPDELYSSLFSPFCAGN